jgi:hypothetical protein
MCRRAVTYGAIRIDPRRHRREDAWCSQAR